MKFARIFFPILLLAGLAFAQVTGSIEGLVFDNNKQPLPGVTVELTSPALQGVRTVTTDVNGKFIFGLLPVGEYKLVAKMQGFANLEQSNIQVSLDRTVSLHVNMQPAFEEKITITGESPVVDVTSTTGGASLSQEMLQDLPSGRSYQNLTFLAAGSVNGGLGNDPSMGGASSAENRYLVDGIDVSDPAYGRGLTNVTYNFIQEVEVKTGGYEAEYGGAMGGIVNVVTKQGSNQFQGEVFGYYTDDSFTAKGKTPEGAAGLAGFKEYDYGFDVGGKLIEDKLWYFVAVNPVMREDQNLLPDGSVYPTKDKGDPFYGATKINWALNPSNTFIFNLTMDPRKNNNLYSGGYQVDVTDGGPNGDFINPMDPGQPIQTDQNMNRTRGGYNYGGTYNAILSPSMMFEFKAGHMENKSANHPEADQQSWLDYTANGIFTCYGGHTDQGVNCGQGIIFGGAGFDEKNTSRWRNEAKAALSYFLGPVELKLGMDYKRQQFETEEYVNGNSPDICVAIGDARGNLGTKDYYGDDDGDGIPNYLDADWSGANYSLADFAALSGRTCTTADGQPGITMPARPGNRWMLQDLAGYFEYYNRNYYNNSVGRTTSYSTYLQAAWKVLPNLTINAGARADASKSEGNRTEAGIQQPLKFSLGDMVSPRIGFIWDFMNNGRSKIYGHYGKFYNDIPMSINVRAFGTELYWFYYYMYPRDADGNPTLPSTANAGMLERIRLSGGLTKIDPNIKPSYEQEIIMGGEYEVMPNVAVGLKGTYRDVSNVMEDYSFNGGSSYIVGNPESLVGVASACVTLDNGLTGTPETKTFCFVKPQRIYRSAELSFNKRFSNNWQASASILWSKNYGNYPGLFRQDNGQLDPYITSLFDLPELLVDTKGLLPNDRTWQYKTYGSYRFPFGLTTGFDAWYESGAPLSKLGTHPDYGDNERFVGQRGSYGRGPDIYALNLHFSYPIKVGGNMEVKAILDAFNIFNFQHAVLLNQQWDTYPAYWTDKTGLWDVNGDGTPDGYEWNPKGCDLPQGDPNRSGYCDYLNPSWGHALQYQDPRSFRIGISIAF